MIRIHRNHPSIVAWSMCNEAFFLGTGGYGRSEGVIEKMVALSHQLDPTRPAAIGGAQRPLGVGRIDKLGDIGGYNGDGATQPDFLNPGIPGVVSNMAVRLPTDRENICRGGEIWKRMMDGKVMSGEADRLSGVGLITEVLPEVSWARWG